MEAIWIDDVDALRDLCEDLAGADAVAVDTESDHYHAYDARVCLIQVASRDRAALIDPLAFDESELRPLFDVLEDPAVTKILHSARNDIQEIDRDWGVAITNLFDTQVAARFLNYERNSLDWLLEEIAGVEPSKKFARFDWTKRPIPAEPRRYAVMDVAHLHDLRDRLEPELAEAGLLEPFRQQCLYFARTTEHAPNEFEPDAWRSVRGAKKLDGGGRAALRELYPVRHEICRRLNRAAVHVFDDTALVDVARRRPTSVDALRDVKGRLIAQVRHDDSDALIAAVKRSLDADAPPERPPREPRRQVPRDERERYDALRKWRNKAVDRHEIPGEFIATNAILSDVASARPSSLAELRDIDGILQWHLERFGDEILDVLSA